MSERDDFGAFLMGFIIGGLTGAAASLLMAPQSGEETRAVIRDKAIVLRDKASQTFDDYYSQAESAAQEAVSRAEDMLAQARGRLEEVQRRGQVMLEEQRRKGETPTPPAETPGDIII